VFGRSVVTAELSEVFGLVAPDVLADDFALLDGEAALVFAMMFLPYLQIKKPPEVKNHFWWR
jgi:hypothetical protein